MKRANMTTLDKLAAGEPITWKVNIRFDDTTEATNDATLQCAVDNLVEVRNRWGDLMGYAPVIHAIRAIGFDRLMGVDWHMLRLLRKAYAETQAVTA